MGGRLAIGLAIGLVIVFQINYSFNEDYQIIAIASQAYQAPKSSKNSIF